MSKAVPHQKRTMIKQSHSAYHVRLSVMKGLGVGVDADGKITRSLVGLNNLLRHSSCCAYLLRQPPAKRSQTTSSQHNAVLCVSLKPPRQNSMPNKLEPFADGTMLYLIFRAIMPDRHEAQGKGQARQPEGSPRTRAEAPLYVKLV